MAIYIYKITNLIDGKSYFGKTIDPSQRWIDHQRCRKINYDFYLCRAIMKYGVENFKFEILDIGYGSVIYTTNELANQTEKFFIKFYNTFAPNGYNMTAGGDGRSIGYKMSEEAKKKISLANKGFKHSEETKRKMREAWSRFDRSKYRSKGRSKGFKHSDETKIKMRKAWCKFGRKEAHSIAMKLYWSKV